MSSYYSGTFWSMDRRICALFIKGREEVAETKEALTITMDDGTVEGTLICNLAGWDCEIYKLQRGSLNKYTNNEKLKECGIYFLVGEQNGEPAIYVGQANSRNNGKGVLGRVMEHDKSTESYWESAFLLHSTSNGLYATELNYLERHYWNRVKSGPYHVMNASKPALGNYSTATKIAMDKFIAGSEMIIRTLGYQFLNPKHHSTIAATSSIEEAKQFYINRNGTVSGRTIAATCEIRNGKFVVLKGSLVATVPRDAHNANDYRHHKYAQLIDGNGRLIQDIPFDKVSGASSFVIYGSSDGKKDWKDAKGKAIELFMG